MNKKSRIMNSKLSSVVTKLMHGDIVVVADAGLPVPPGVDTLDLAIQPGIPNLEHILPLLKEELVIENVIVASEMEKVNKSRFDYVHELFGNMKSSGGDDLIRVLDHDHIEEMLPKAKLIVQTAEISPYGNVVFVGGVSFFEVGMAGD